MTLDKNVTVSGVSIVDAAKVSNGLNRALWIESNLGSISVDGVAVTDKQLPATGFVIGEWNNKSYPIDVSNITSAITNGSLVIETSSADAVFTKAGSGR